MLAKQIIYCSVLYLLFNIVNNIGTTWFADGTHAAGFAGGHGHIDCSDGDSPADRDRDGL